MPPSSRSLLVGLLLLLPLGCGGEDEPLVGDTSFRLTQDCVDGVCTPVCEETYCDMCDHSVPPNDGGCWITGIGYVVDSNDGQHDNFGGNGMPMKAGYLRGQWEHVDHKTGDKFHGDVGYLVCRHVDEPGPDVPKTIPNQTYYGGPGQWYEPGKGWQDGFWFDVMAEDHGEPGSTDEYYFTVRRQSDNTVIYQVGGILGGGNFQVHPPNSGHPFTEGTLPSWVSLQP